jgi:hypothetical protein
VVGLAGWRGGGGGRWGTWNGLELEEGGGERRAAESQRRNSGDQPRSCAFGVACSAVARRLFLAIPTRRRCWGLGGSAAHAAACRAVQTLELEVVVVVVTRTRATTTTITRAVSVWYAEGIPKGFSRELHTRCFGFPQQSVRGGRTYG